MKTVDEIIERYFSDKVVVKNTIEAIDREIERSVRKNNRYLDWYFDPQTEEQIKEIIGILLDYGYSIDYKDRYQLTILW